MVSNKENSTCLNGYKFDLFLFMCFVCAGININAYYDNQVAVQFVKEM